MTAPFIHLNVHSEYSILDGIVRVKELVDQAAEMGMPAVAITDHSNLFAMVKFYRAAISNGIKPLIGAELVIADASARTEGFPLILLCQNVIGYKNLSGLITRAYQEGQERGSPKIHADWLPGCQAGLIALSGAEAGDVGQALLEENAQLAGQRLAYWRELFGDRYYVELRRTGKAEEEVYLQRAIDLAAEQGVPVVATNAVHFSKAADYEAHEARVCIQDGDQLNDPNRKRRYTAQQYLRSAEEMHSLFVDIPEALENSLEIARRCNFELRLGNPLLPDFEVPVGQTVSSQLEYQAKAGLEAILSKRRQQGRLSPELQSRYYLRLETELKVIGKMGFPGYFLIVADFIEWSWKNDVPVGPGRGSGAGSLVAYALGITRIDPLDHNLLFERFLNPERVSLPDFDIDFCMEGRDRVIEYVMERYGRDRVSQIITYGTMAAKAVVRDVGRVLGMPYGLVDSIAKLIPMELGITLEKALVQEAEFKRRYQEEDEVRTLIDLAKPLEGVVRNAGKHAGGVVISPSKLTDFMPLYTESGGGGSVTQFDKDDVEDLGLVKFDFLGLRTLTVIDWAVKSIKRLYPEQRDLDIDQISLTDRATYELLMRGETTAVFQLESRGMKELIGRLLPDCFEDVVALVALYRPGPLQSGMVEDFIDRKHGKANIDYLEPRLQPVLHDTYGVILYQEQVMQIAQVLANYSLGQADLLRRAMGKKKAADMAKQRAAFLAGAISNQVSEQKAIYIFDLMEKFAGYGFNKSHSAAYAQISYQTAWLKTNYPAAFMAAALSADIDNTDKVVELLRECKAMGIRVEAPDVNRGFCHFLPSMNKEISYGLGAIKGVGQSAVESICTEREDNGPFPNLYQFCERVDLKKVNKRAVEALIKAGAMDCLGGHRAALINTLPRAIDVAEQQLQNRASGQNDLFGNLVEQPAIQLLVPTEPWAEEELLRYEKEVMGCYFSGHPVDFYADEQKGISHCQLVDLASREGQHINVLGQIVSIKTISRGRSGALLVLEDDTAQIDLVIFRGWEEFRSTVEVGDVIIAQGKVTKDRFNGNYNLQGNGVISVENAREKLARGLHLVLDPKIDALSLAEKLAAVVGVFTGGTVGLSFDYRNEQASGRLRLGEGWLVHPKDDLIRQLKKIDSVQQVEVHY